MDTIPAPLRDRMEVVSLSGYTEEEKLVIARRYLVPRQLGRNGLAPEQVEITDDALAAIVRGYTREAGVRNLEREIGAVLRHVAARFAEGNAGMVRIGPGRSGADPGRRPLRAGGRGPRRHAGRSRRGWPGRRSGAISYSSKRPACRAAAS